MDREEISKIAQSAAGKVTLSKRCLEKAYQVIVDCECGERGEEGRKIAEEVGVYYDGEQEGVGHQFTDLVTGTTFYGNTVEEVRRKLAEKRELFGSNPGEYVTITDPGKTTFNVGQLISREAFEKENERVKKLGEKPATGR